MRATSDYRVIEVCRACHARLNSTDPCLTMSPMPLAGQFCHTKEEALTADLIPLNWLTCQHCGLVQVMEDVNEEVLFRNYNYASSTVSGLVHHFEEYASKLRSIYQHLQPRFLEIGCNDGVLLRRLPREWEKCGVDPSDIAQSSHLQGTTRSYELVSAPFNTQLVSRQQWVGKWDVISGSNCLAHISNLKDVFEGVALALRQGGEFWVEVHDLAALLKGNQWDTIYHEHKVEWSLDSLTHCLGLMGFRRMSYERIPMHGGALRVRFKKGNPHHQRTSPASAYASSIASLKRAYECRYQHPSVQQLRSVIDRGGRIAAYGAAGRANVYLNQMLDLPFAWIVDEAPLRVGKFLPRVGTPVVSAERLISDPPDHCLITAWNYRRDIQSKNPHYTGTWLTAFDLQEQTP
jgi:SAM-dependent methyltransferase